MTKIRELLHRRTERRSAPDADPWRSREPLSCCPVCRRPLLRIFQFFLKIEFLEVFVIGVMNLVWHTGHDNAIEVAERERHEQRRVLVQSLLPEGVHDEMPHDDVNEAAGGLLLNVQDVFGQRLGKLAIRRRDKD